MANPQPDKFTRISNEYLDKLCLCPLNGSELRIMLFIIRKTWGWKKKADKISITQIQEGVGLSRKMVCETINKLVTKSLLLKTEGKINTLQINKDYDKWVVTKRLLGSYEKVTTLVTKSKLELVTKSKHTKDNIKDNITKDITTNVVTEFGNSEINQLSNYFLQAFSLPEEDCPTKQSRRYWYLLLRKSKTGVNGVKWLIDLASKDEWYKNNITSSKDLYYKRIKIIQRKRGEQYDRRRPIDARNIE